MITVILYTYMAVSFASNGAVIRQEWRANGEFRGEVACYTAIKQLGLNDSNAKCISKGY